jgi:hypothetical protein
MSKATRPAPKKPFWDLTVPEISQWIHSLTPGIPNTGGMLFPPSATTTTASDNKCNNTADQGELLVKNLLTALSSASSFDNIHNDASLSSDDANKRQKIYHNNCNNATNNNGAGGGDGDRYGILDPSFAIKSSCNNDNNKNNNKNLNTSELSPGAILSRITLGGLVNGMSGVHGGCVDTLSCIPLSDLQRSEAGDDCNDGAAVTKGIDAVIEPAGNLLLKDLIKLARGLLHSISAR